MPISLSPLMGTEGATPISKTNKVQEAARQFEGLMIAQMLKDARESSKLDDGEEDSSSQTSPIMDVADQQFAQMLAQKGGIGLGNLAAAGLEKKL